MNKKAFTLLEIIISVVILSLIMAGLIGVLVAGKGFIQHSRYRMGAGEIGKRFLDPIQSYVRQDTWATNPLGTNSIATATDGVYTATYIANSLAEANMGAMKKVTATITWNE